jgi:hypothetical protein
MYAAPSLSGLRVTTPYKQFRCGDILPNYLIATCTILMLLTLSKPVKSEFEFKTHDYPQTYSTSPVARYSTKLPGGHLPSQPASATFAMGTPHRGLPPPSAMTLPDPGRGAPITPSLGSLPPAPSQWQGAEDGMKNWLMAKAEEEKRKQEEEKTRQETLKLEQRKLESDMLRESIQGGVPPHLVPIIFAGIGGGNLANISAEWIQQYQMHLQTAQQQQQVQAQAQAQSQLSPELRRETRLIGQPQSGVFGAQQQPQHTVLPPSSILPGQPIPSQSQHSTFSTTTYAGGNISPRARATQAAHAGPPTSAPRPPHQSQLPRLTTNEIHIQQPPAAPSNIPQLQQNPPQPQDQQSTSPSIYFHHWVPPTTQQEKPSSGNPPATPSGKFKTSPSFLSRQRATSHASDPDYTSSPKKRKAQGGHPAPPPPTSAPQSYNSPSFSHISTSSASTPGRRGHARARSDASTRGEGHGASLSRRGTVSSHAHTEAGAQYADMSEHRFHPPSHGGDRGDNQHHHHPPDSAYTTGPQRNERRHGPQATSMAYQAETRQFDPQSMERGPAPSPKRESGMQ